ncbi:alpha,alpha-trehalase TreF [Lichenicola sp.]|uniref:alpha,alpha-trehalase TreF n=1 Tax=Lichenicola sp. TaxID=2804529 RepID=UPI003AFFBBB4
MTAAYRVAARAGWRPPVMAMLAMLVAWSASATPAAHAPASVAAGGASRTRAAPPPVVLQPPSVLFGDLYREVEMQHVFGDQKTFADAVPRKPPEQVMGDYAVASAKPDFDLRAFVAAHFTLSRLDRLDFTPRPDQPIADYIARMWTVLQRRPDATQSFSSLLPLRYPYVVPGGRFSEIYYWDSYFTMLGLEHDRRHDLATDMIRNMASLIDRYGHIPNGNRTYYLSRSEPPFFACMIDLMAAHDGPQAYLTYLPELAAEYRYWMQGEDDLAPGRAHRHVVRLADGIVMNRYWDDRDVPRDESYAEDVATAKTSGRPPAEIYRELRAGGETGWDFSSRWLADGRTLGTIRVTQLLPVDLNSLIAHMEQTLAHGYELRGEPRRADYFRQRAAMRIAAIRRLMWDQADGVFTDYLWTDRRQTGTITAATVVPLFLGLATPEEGARVADTVRTRLLRPGGMTTSLDADGQQWDGPNGWAPMQWMAVVGLRAYGKDVLAADIASRWIERQIAAYTRSGVLLEKYNVRDDRTSSDGGGGGGGEYPLQVGFGWTNGVLAVLMQLYPGTTRASLETNPAIRLPASPGH